MNAKQLIEVLSKFPSETPVLKATTEGNYSYEAINEYAHGPYPVVACGKSSLGDTLYQDSNDEHVESFKAIVL